MWLSVHRYHKCMISLPLLLLRTNQPTTQKLSCPLKDKFPFANGVVLALFCPLGQDESGPARGLSLSTYHLLFSKISHQHLKYNCAMGHQPHCLALCTEHCGIPTCAGSVQPSGYPTGDCSLQEVSPQLPLHQEPTISGPDSFLSLHVPTFSGIWFWFCCC